MKIGVCGAERMASSIAQRLMSVGHEVEVWNRSLAKTKPLTDAGAKLFASPAELVAGCEVIIVMLLNDAATESVYREPNAILKSKLAGNLVIDRSTVRPDTMTSNGSSVLQQSAAFVECPVAMPTQPRSRSVEPSAVPRSQFTSLSSSPKREFNSRGQIQ